MPTIFRLDGFVVLVLNPPREHGPAHVHVAKAGGEVLINIPAVAIREVRGMKPADVRRAVAIVAERVDDCVAKWEEIHGKD